jgi:hypothetical protein
MYDICERLRSTPRADIREVMCEAADEIERLRNQVEQLRSEVTDAKKWAMQERSLRWHNLAATDAKSTMEGSNG